MKILANEPLTCVAGEDVYEVLHSYQTEELHGFISKHAANQYAGLMYLSDWTKVLNDIDTFLNEITHTKRHLYIFVSNTAFFNLASAEDLATWSKLVNVLKFTENLLKQVYGKEFYQSAEHLLMLTASGDDEIAALALSCLHNLTSFPDNHHSVVLEDRHITMLHKNASYFWSLFQIVEACLGGYSTAQQLLSQSFVLPPTVINVKKISVDSDAIILPILYPASPLATLFGDTVSSTDTAIEIAIDNDAVQSASSANDLKFLALWRLRTRKWLFDYDGRKLLVACLLRCCAILLSSYPDSNFLSTFFHDKVDLIKDLIYLINMGPLTLPEPGQVWKKDDLLEIRMLATWCMSSLVDSKDQTATPMVLHYPWILYELGVQRGQYMGLIPCLIRCCVATLTPLRRDLAMRSRNTSNKQLTEMESDVLSWIERILIMIFYVSSLNFVLPALLENGLISSMLSLAATEGEALFPQLMWIDNLAFTIMEVAMGLSPVSFVNFREHLGPEILIGRMNKLVKVSLHEAGGGKVTSSQISLLQQFISGISCYLQENQMEGDDGGASQHFRDPLLMEAFSFLFDNAERFHGSVPAAGIALLSEMMSRDAAPPSVVTFVVSSGLAKKALDVAIKDISITNNDLPLAVISFVSALSLTADGVDLVIATAALQNILRMFSNVINYLPYSRNLVGEHTGGLNASLEELLRHNPVYRTVVIGSLIDAMQKVITFAKTDESEDGESRIKHFQTAVFPYMIAANSILCILEQLFVRKDNASYFLTEYGVKTLVKLKQLAMGDSVVFLVVASCAMEGSSTANGYTPLLTTLGRVIHQLSSHDRKLILTQTIDMIFIAQESFVDTCLTFQRDVLHLPPQQESGGIDFDAILEALNDAPLSILLQQQDDNMVMLKQYSQVFQSLSILGFLYEMFYECQGGRSGKTVDGKEVFAMLKEKNFHTLMPLALETIYGATQKGLAKYKVGYRIPGLSKDPWIIQPNYVLLLVGDNATARDSCLETSKRIGRLSRGSIVIASERLLVGSVVKYKTVHGTWVNQFRSHHGVEQQVMVIDVVEKTEEEKQKFLAEKVASSTNQEENTVSRRFEMDKYARVTARRGAAFIIYCHHIVVKTYLMGSFSRLFHKVDALTGAKDLALHTRTKDFVDLYVISNFISCFRGLLSPYVVEDVTNFDLDVYLQTLEESSLEGDEEDSLEEWSRRSFSLQAKLHVAWDIDAVLISTRVIDLVRSLLRDPRKQRLSDISAIVVKIFFEDDHRLLQLLLGATSCLFHVCMEEEEASQETSNVEVPLRLKEVKLVALSSLETVIDLWKDVLSSLVISAQENVPEEFGCGELSRRRICLMIARYLLPIWTNQGFVSLPASIVRNAMDFASVLAKGFHELGQHAEPRASKSAMSAILASTTRPTTTASGGMAASYAALRRASAARVAAPALTPFQPNDATVQQIIEMGFERNSIINAMRMLRTNNAAQLVPFLIENPFLHGVPGGHDEEEEAAVPPAAGTTGGGDNNPTVDAVVDAAVGASDDDRLIAEITATITPVESALDNNREKLFISVYTEAKNERALSTRIFQVLISMAFNVVMASLEHGKATLNDVVDGDMISVDSAIDEDMFVTLLLNVSIKFLESFQFGEVTVRLLQITWLYKAGIRVLATHGAKEIDDETLHRRLRGILHAVVINLTCKIVNWTQRRSLTNCAELLLIVVQHDPRLYDFHKYVVNELYRSKDSMIVAGIDEKQLDRQVSLFVPGILLLDLLQQNVLIDGEALRATVRDNIDNLHKYNPGRMKDLKAIQASTEDLLHPKVKAFIQMMYNAKPLLLSNFYDEEKIKMMDVALTMLKITSGNNKSGKKKLAELARASMQLITHTLSSSLVIREHFARSRGVEHLLECSISYEGLSSIAFSILQRYLEDDLYLKQAIKVVLKLVYDRLKKTERFVSLKSLIEAACPMLYRDQTCFLEDIQELFAIDFTPDGTMLKLKDASVADSKQPNATNENEQKTEESKAEQVATATAVGSAAKRQKISETQSVPTKIIVETPLKRKGGGDHHNNALRNSRLLAVQEIVDLIVTKIVESWLFIAKECGLISNSSTEAMEEETRSLSLPDNFMILSDLIASFPAVAVSLQKKRVQHPVVQVFMRGKRQGHGNEQKEGEEDVSFAAFVLHCFLLHDSSESIDQIDPENAVTRRHSFGSAVQDSCRYLLASIISRPNDGGRMSIMHEIANLLSSYQFTYDLRPIPKLVELLTAFVNPPAKWLQRELFMLPGRDICSSLINSDIYAQLFAVIQLKNPLAEKALSSLSNIIDIILRKQQQSNKDGNKTAVDPNNQVVGGNAVVVSNNPITGELAAAASDAMMAMEGDHAAGSNLAVHSSSQQQSQHEGQHAADFEDFHEQLLYTPSQALLPSAALAREEDDEDLDEEHGEEDEDEDEHDGVASINQSLDEQEGDESDDDSDDDDDEIGEHEEIILDEDAAELIMEEMDQHEGGHHHGHGHHQSEDSSQSSHAEDHDHEGEENDHEEDDDGMMEGDEDDDDEMDDEDINSEDASEEHPGDDAQQDDTYPHDHHDGEDEDDYGDDEDIIEDGAVNGFGQGHEQEDEDAMDIVDDNNDEDNVGENFEMVEHMFEHEEDDDEDNDHHTPEQEAGGDDDYAATTAAGRAFVFDPELGMIPINQAMGRGRRGGRDSSSRGRRIRMDFGGEEGGGPGEYLGGGDYDPSDGIGFRFRPDYDGGGMEGAGVVGGTYEGRLTFSEFHDLFPGAISRGNMSRMMSSHSRNVAMRTGTSLPVPAISPHPLLMAVDSRRGRVPALWSTSSSSHQYGGASTMSSSQGAAHYTLDIQSRNRSQVSNKRRALGPLLSDRRWGTDITDLELPSSRLSTLTTVVEQYLEGVLPHKGEEGKVMIGSTSVNRASYNPFGFPFHRGHWESKEDEGELQESKEEIEGEREEDWGEALPRRVSLRSTPFRGLWGATGPPTGRAPRPLEESKDEGELRETKEDDPPTAAIATRTGMNHPATTSSSSAAALAFDSIFQAFANNVPTPLRAASMTADAAELIQQLQNLADNEEQGDASNGDGNGHDGEMDDDEDEDEEGMEEEDGENDYGEEGDEVNQEEGDDGNYNNGDEDEMEVVDFEDNIEQVAAPVAPTEPVAMEEEAVNENLLFLESLPNDLRRDVLMAAEQSFLDSLPAHIQVEAMDLREGQAIQFQMDTFEPPPMPTAPVPATNDPQEANNMFAAAIQRFAAQQHAQQQQQAIAPPRTLVASRTAPGHALQHQLESVARSPEDKTKRNDDPVWYLPLTGDSYDLSSTPLKAPFLLKLMEWNICGKLDRSPSRFRMFQLVFGDHLNRRGMSRALISLMTGNALEVGIDGFDEFKVQLQQQQSELVIYRRVLLTWTHLFRKSNHLLWHELTCNNEQSRSLFHEMLSCLGRIKLPTVEFEQSLTLIERICKVWSRLTVEQVNSLVASFATPATATSSAEESATTAGENETEAVNAVTATQAVAAAGESWRPTSARASCATSSSIFPGGSPEEDFRNRLAQLMGHGPSSSSAAARHRHRQNAAVSDSSVKKEKMHFPVLESRDSRGMIAAYIEHDCSSNARRIYNKIFRVLSLYDGNWRLFLTGLAEQADGLVCLTTLEFQSLLTVLQTAVDQQEDVIHVLSRPELSSPKVLKEAQLLHALKLMTMLRSRSSAVAATEALVVAEYLRGINSGDLWDMLCECLDKVREIEENQLDREARRNRRSASFSYASSASAAASTTDLAATGNAAAAVAEGGSGRPLSALTMRFIPLIECFLSIFSRTMFVAPSQQQDTQSPVQQALSVGEDGSLLPVTQSLPPTQTLPSTSSTATAAAGEVVNRNHSHLLPGGRFRQSPSYLAMQLEVSEDKAAAQLLRFAENHHDLLNKVLRNNIHLLESSFSPLVNVPKLRALLHFDIKRAYFRAKIKRLRQTNSARMYGGIRLTVRRARVFEESFQALRHKTADEMRRRLSISFHNEEGMDAGGLTREWYHLLAREIFNPNYALFLSTTEDGVTFQPNAQSWVNPDHLSYFKFVGRIIGKALCDGALLDAHFTRPFYKHILGLPVSLQDLEAIEPAYYKSMLQLLETPLDLLGLDLTFAAETNDFGKIEIVDLIPDGQKIPVTDETKHEYVKLLAHHRMTAAIRKQIESFLDGFHELVPAELISIFDAQEVELLISGLPEIDVDDMRGHCDYHGYRPADPLINWFWAALKTFSKEEKALFLQFVTGTSKVPLDGFKALQGADGVKRLNIHRAYGGDVALPTAHTCFNQLDLPEYSSEDILREKLLLAIREGSEGFGFA